MQIFVQFRSEEDRAKDKKIIVVTMAFDLDDGTSISSLSVCFAHRVNYS